MTTCYVCEVELNPRVEVRYTMDKRTFCSGACIFKYRGNRRIW